MNISIIVEKEEYMPRAEALAKVLGCEIVTECSAGELCLIYKTDGLTLTDGKLSMRGDYSDMVPRLYNDKLASEMLVRAAKPKKDAELGTIIDATAGMGEDSLLLAAAGFDVVLYEKDPVICALLEDTVERAKSIPGLDKIASRMHVLARDSIEALNSIEEAPYAVFLDPMFPQRQKSGLIKKKFQLLQQLEAPCGDETELIQAAINAHPQKIIIKRPQKGPFLGGIKPSSSLQGKNIRYDIVIPK